MKVLSTIKAVKVSRQYKRQDGSYAAIYGITIEAGDDTIYAETFITKDGQQKRGITPGAIGTAILEMSVRDWTDNSGSARHTQDVKLTDFVIANRNLFNGPAEQEPSASAASVEQVMTQVGQDTVQGDAGGDQPF